MTHSSGLAGRIDSNALKRPLALARKRHQPMGAFTPRWLPPDERPEPHLLIAATACAAGLPLYTRNPSDFAALGDLVEVVAV